MNIVDGWRIEDGDGHHRSSINCSRLVSKMPHAGEDHGDAMFVGGGDDFFVFDRAAGLDNRLGAAVGGFIEAVAEWIKSVGGDRGAFQVQTVSRGPQHGDLGRVDAAHLAGADAEHLVGRREHDGVGFYMAANPPGEIEGAIFVVPSVCVR